MLPIVSGGKLALLPVEGALAAGLIHPWSIGGSEQC
ncbi:hypothetical protein ABH929_003604 [Curtobacterium sp. AB7]